MESPADLTAFDAMLFDLDGVITRTATVHAAAWKALFDEFGQRWAAERGTAWRPFDDDDYLRYVDGRRRLDGIRSFLASRGIDLDDGDPADGPDATTVAGLGRRKDRWFNAALARDGIEVFDDGVALLRRLHDLGQPLAVVSASENASPILERAGLLELFDVRVTGVEAGRLGLAGKPAPDTFLEAARQLDVPPARAVVFEDALAGVQAGRAGGFGLVVGVDRSQIGSELAANGADVVVQDLRVLEPRPAR